MEFYKGVPGPGDGPGQIAKISDQGGPVELSDEGINRAHVDGFWADPSQARPPGEAREAMSDPPVGRRKKAGPDLVEVEVVGFEHRPQA